jgi:hypothetical protein
MNNCPRCLIEFNTPPALSRRDNKTSICSHCGTEEAINDATPFDNLGEARLKVEIDFHDKIGMSYADWYAWKRGLAEHPHSQFGVD